MKLTLVGAGSTRLPLMLGSIAAASRDCRLDELVLFDIQPDRVRALLPVGQALAREVGNLPPCRLALDPRDALDGADAVLYTIRPGFEAGRAHDERTCLDLGVLGQETTGPAGMAFAARSIPAVLEYCRIAARSNPACLPIVFTNPAGMVTQALADAGFDRAIGVCDSATVAAHALGRRAGIPFDSIDFEVYGLNHLSWTRRATSGGRDLLAEGLGDRRFLETLIPWYAKESRELGRIPVEYLYYWLRAGQAVDALLAEARTRGEVLAHTNQSLLADVHSLVAAGQVSDAILRYAAYLDDRNGTYMEYARPDHAPARTRFPDAPAALSWLAGQIGGYAEVALDVLAGRTGAGPRLMALNIPCRGTMPGMESGDVVETDCLVDDRGVTPRPHQPLPDQDLELVTRVKEYERQAVVAIRDRSPARAVDALVAHPLVGDRSLAELLVAKLEIFVR